MAKKDSLKDESKGSKDGKKNNKGGKKPSLSDVKEANKAVLEFPADANKTPGIEVANQVENTEAFPNDRVEGLDTPPAPAPVIENIVNETPAIPTPAPVDDPTPDPIDENPLNPGVFGNPIIISETKSEPAKTEPTEPVVNEPVVNEAITNPVVTEPVVTETVTETPVVESVIEEAPEPVKPTQEELEEKVIERWYNSQNKPADVNHFELAYSSGINMDRFSNLEAKVGKFKFNRSFVGDKWQITVDETK